MEYKDLLELVEQVERESKKSDTAFVDITSIMEGHGESKVTYNDLLKMISSMNVQKFKEVAEEQKPRAPSHLITSGVEQASYAQPIVQSPIASANAEPSQVEVQGIRESGHINEAATAQQAPEQKAKVELGSIVRNLGPIKKLGGIKIKRVNTSQLVLPNLTLADQIAELERIIEGLKENVFDNEHMQIVVEELTGLNQVVNDMKKKGTASKSELEQSLINLRDERLIEALALLPGGNG
ncbi:MAG: hypothetical protein ACP5RM_02180 [Candidatus Micrarchaeia archaeon]